MKHKLILDYKAGPAVYYRCIRCRGKGFYLTNLLKQLPTGGQKIIAKAVYEGQNIEAKMLTTLNYVDKTKQVMKLIQYGYYTNKDVQNLETLANYDCDEVIIKEIVE